MDILDTLASPNAEETQCNNKSIENFEFYLSSFKINNKKLSDEVYKDHLMSKFDVVYEDSFMNHYLEVENRALLSFEDQERVTI